MCDEVISGFAERLPEQWSQTAIWDLGKITCHKSASRSAVFLRRLAAAAACQAPRSHVTHLLYIGAVVEPHPR